MVLVASVCACRRHTTPQASDATKVSVPVRVADPRAELGLVDSHVHITPLDAAMNEALRIFDAVGVSKFAVKSAGSYGSPRYQATVRFANYLGESMAFFINLDWNGIDEAGWGEREADHLERAANDGASGIKIFKALGLGVRLANGKLLQVDDARLDPIFERAARVGAIVAWHVADPVAFFEPPTADNERYEELSIAEDWSFHGKDFPSHDELIAARDRVVKKHPKTKFLGIHLANYPENLDYVAGLLDACPNMHVDISARLPEIGRHPAAKAGKFFIKYQDRILFGSDLIVSAQGLQLGSVSEKTPGFEDAVEFYRRHRRYFETTDKQFDHPTPIQGRWKIDGIDLPPAVLKKIYSDNAERMIFAPRRAFLKRKNG